MTYIVDVQMVHFNAWVQVEYKAIANSPETTGNNRLTRVMCIVFYMWMLDVKGDSD